MASVPALALLPALSCLAALLSCVFSAVLWRRVDTGQEAAKSSMYAAGKLFDHAARRFAHAQDQAAASVEAAAGAAGQAGQAAARLAALVRDVEQRLSAALGEAEMRLHAASALMARHENAAADVPHALAEALDRIGAATLPDIAEATAALRDCAASASSRLLDEWHTLPALMAEAVAAADARGAEAIQTAALSLHSRAALIGDAAECLPGAAAALNEAAAGLSAAQASQMGLIARVEALTGVLPSIATSLASTAAGQRQLLSQGRLGVEAGIAELRQAAVSLSACIDEASAVLRRVPAPPSMHPALRPRDLNPAGLAEMPVRRGPAIPVLALGKSWGSRVGPPRPRVVHQGGAGIRTWPVSPSIQARADDAEAKPSISWLTPSGVVSTTAHVGPALRVMAFKRKSHRVILGQVNFEMAYIACFSMRRHSNISRDRHPRRRPAWPW